jgi:aerotaxis receptor
MPFPDSKTAPAAALPECGDQEACVKVNLPVTQNEVFLDPARPIVTKTDLKGQITYANRAFIDISGFAENELIGVSHNIVRHPDMPPEAFADLWTTLKAGRPWSGLVKNRNKAGDFYWVEAWSTGRQMPRAAYRDGGQYYG